MPSAAVIFLVERLNVMEPAVRLMLPPRICISPLLITISKLLLLFAVSMMLPSERFIVEGEVPLAVSVRVMLPSVTSITVPLARLRALLSV